LLNFYRNSLSSHANRL